jgi:hypothetical protein
MASDLIPHKIWMERTAIRGHRRSKELKALDSALEEYGEYGGGHAQWAVGQALEAWKKSKGPGDAWKRSSRNKNGAIDDLTKALGGFHHSKEQREAVLLVKAQQKLFIKSLFEGRRVSLSSKALTAYQAADSAKTLHTLTSPLYQSSDSSPARDAAMKLIKNVLGDVWDMPELAEIVLEVLGEALKDLAKSIAPAVGFVMSGAKTAYYGLQTISKAKDVYVLSGVDEGVMQGDPQAALEAVKRLMKRELKKSGKRLAISASETTAKGLGLFADGGTATTTAVGTAASIARLLVTLNALRIDCLEMRAANNILKHPDKIDRSLFQKNPLLACYFLVCADTSTIVNFMFENVGRPGFQYEVERAVKKHLDPTLKIASHLLYEHRMMLSGGELAKVSVKGSQKGQIAIRNPSTTHHVKANVVNKVRGRSKGFYK